jgi:hypothetical protein
LDEAEDTRMLSVLGLFDLREALERYEREHGVSRDDPNLDAGDRGELQAAWERTQMAEAAIATDFAAVNAQALLAVNNALDAMVEEYAPAMREIVVNALVDQGLKRAEDVAPDAASQLNEATREALMQALAATIDESLPKLKRMEGSGTERYEAPLRRVGLGTPADRPIPEDLDEALTEFGAIRDVLTHRHGRIDPKALKQAPSLAPRYIDGDFVRLNREDYFTYSAAIRCYGQDVAMRPMQRWPDFDKSQLPNLSAWRRWRILGP